MLSIKRNSIFVVLALSVLLLTVPRADAARLRELPSAGPGPAGFDQVTINKFGPRTKALRQVLVLMPGTAGGAGDFTLLARELVRRVDGLGVWAIDRRSRPLEDTGTFERVAAGEIGVREAFDYYLGWLGGDGPDEHFEFLDPDTVPFAKRWGMRTALRDARQVVAHAAGRGRSVILGGHSLGASLATAYAAWDFGGTPGYSEIDGVVLIDGGLLGSFDSYDRDEAAEQLETLEERPFLDLLGIGIPEAAGLFAEIGGWYALRRPDRPARTLQEFSLLPPAFRPPVPVTYEALLGHAFDRDTSPEALSLLHVNAGGLAPAGDPRPWEDGGITAARAVARTFGQEPANAVEWYFPRRLSIDTNAASPLRQTPAARLLGLRLRHTEQIDVPVYAFQSDLTDGRVLRGARRLIAGSASRRSDAMLVDGTPEASHLDPLTAGFADNEFLQTVVGFLRANRGGRG